MGTAVFRHSDGPACIDYTVTVDEEWKTTDGEIYGFVGDRTIRHQVKRRPSGWSLDGRHQRGLDHLVDLDLGFTPATNLLQLSRAAVAIGAAAEFDVAWFDIGMEMLAVLPQCYRRDDATTYQYAAPSVPYEATLEMAPNGFVKTYPGLWAMES